MDNRHSIPKVIRIVAWLWIVGALWKLSITPFSWADFELWRNIFLLTTKSLFLVSGILLLLGYKHAAFVYLTVTIANTTVFYLYPPNLVGTDQYFTPQAIALAVVAPVIFVSILLFNWKSLRWS